jgi:ankyrin repeat protein
LDSFIIDLDFYFIRIFKRVFIPLKGANPNAGSHEFSYTSLHFAALTGNSEICRMLLEAGVKVDAVNSVKRTATQMAAFVGKNLYKKNSEA